MTQVELLGKKAQQAAKVLSAFNTAQKNTALFKIADALEQKCDQILKANQKDLATARQNNTSEAMLDRLMLNADRLSAIADAVRNVAKLADPIGEILSGFVTPGGLNIRKVRVPMGVVGIIYEARPNVTPDAASLCLKSSNAVILRGGKEAIHSNLAMVTVMREALREAGFPEDCIGFIEDTTRESTMELMRLNEYIDVLIPRGGAGLIQAVVQNASVPVIETGTGNCHIYVDQDADVQMAVDILFNAKTSRPSVCNAAENILVHQAIAERFLPLAKQKLDEKGVLWYGCERTRQILGDSVLPATAAEYGTEFLDYKIAAKVVDSIEEAMDHISAYGTKHSEAIVTESYRSSELFTKTVDAAAVYVNASTRFTDGGEFGLGAEIGISTQKLHARGPMGLNELTTIKYIINGQGQIR